ncbi:MAG TPA: 1,6-anhydro-N-acetylmuramyl-L-alanine amidase AmpD [Burkholderiales bacterium]|nr:1,6-anhydro-N-acetylmuramyl-L-alanine amidase AmpD [Burkholderiales bacterium]
MTISASWMLSGDGMLPAARHVPSPNFDDRPDGVAIDLLVIHNISLPPAQFGGPGIVELFTNCLDPDAHPYYRQIADARVSSHFLVRRDGEIIQFVACGRRAWHAGQSHWKGRTRCNDFSIGIELEGTDDQAFTDVQYDMLARLAASLRRAYPTIECAGHSDIAVPPGRKTDPGPHFDWNRFRAMLGQA